MKGVMDIKSPQRVLIVDDEPLICWSITETLASCGDIVTDAKNGEEALCAMSNTGDPIDVVLLDYSLPDAQDLTLLATLRRVSPRTRMILMSVHYTDEMATAALALGATRVVSKPINMDDIPSLVHGVASRPPE